MQVTENGWLKVSIESARDSIRYLRWVEDNISARSWSNDYGAGGTGWNIRRLNDFGFGLELSIEHPDQQALFILTFGLTE